VSAERLDELFGDLAEANRKWLLAYTEAKPSPSLTTTARFDRLIDAHQELERLVNEIESVFATVERQR
jgi:hypothetical protein